MTLTSPHHLSIYAVDEISKVIEVDVINKYERSAIENIERLISLMNGVGPLGSNDKDFFDFKDMDHGIMVTFIEECRGHLSSASSQVEELIDDLQDQINSMRNDLSDSIYCAIGESFIPVFGQAMSIAKGKGAREKLLEEFSDVLVRMMDSTRERAAKEIVKIAHDSVESISLDIDKKIRVELVDTVSIIDENRSGLVSACNIEKKRSNAKKLETIIRKAFPSKDIAV